MIFLLFLYVFFYRFPGPRLDLVRRPGNVDLCVFVVNDSKLNPNPRAVVRARNKKSNDGETVKQKGGERERE